MLFKTDSYLELFVWRMLCMLHSWPRHNENQTQHRRILSTGVLVALPLHRYDRCRRQISHRPMASLNYKIADRAIRVMYAAYYLADIYIPIRFAEIKNVEIKLCWSIITNWRCESKPQTYCRYRRIIVQKSMLCIIAKCTTGRCWTTTWCGIDFLFNVGMIRIFWHHWYLEKKKQKSLVQAPIVLIELYISNGFFLRILFMFFIVFVFVWLTNKQFYHPKWK